jgi:hypothetical protein
MEMVRESRSVLQSEVARLDTLAASYWRLAASGRGPAYNEWLNEVKKVAKNIELRENSKQKADKHRIK